MKKPPKRPPAKTKIASNTVRRPKREIVNHALQILGHKKLIEILARENQQLVLHAVMEGGKISREKINILEAYLEGDSKLRKKIIDYIALTELKKSKTKRRK